jgi:hypothetical protein
MACLMIISIDIIFIWHFNFNLYVLW